MKREELKQIGLTDEQVGSVMAMHAAELNTLRSDLSDVTSERDSLKNELASNQDELKKMQATAKDNDDLQAQLQALQTKFDESQQAVAAKLQAVKKDNAIDQALLKAKARNNKAVRALLNDDAIKFDDDGLHGLSEQLAALQKSEAYLFATEPKGDDPSNGNNGPKIFPNGNPETPPTPNNDDALRHALGLKTK